MFEMTVAEICELTDGRLHGPENVAISGVRDLDHAGPGDLSFAGDESRREKAASSSAGALLTAEKIEDFDGTQIVCDDVEKALVAVLKEVRNTLYPRPTGISNKASISADATLGDEVSVGDYAVIEANAEIAAGVTIYPLAYIGRSVQIGSGTVVHPHATICAGARIGGNCEIHPNVVIADDGFGYFQRGGKSTKFPHIGTVRIGDNVSVHGLSSIDRGMIEDTVVGEGVKVDKHCQIAHNCEVGEHCIMAGGAQVAGSCTLGKFVVLGGMAGVADHVQIGEGSQFGGKSGITRDVKPGSKMFGTPARPFKQQMRIHVLQARLPNMRNRIKKLEKEIVELKKRLDDKL